MQATFLQTVLVPQMAKRASTRHLETAAVLQTTVEAHLHFAMLAAKLGSETAL